MWSRPTSAAPSQGDGRSWGRHFQRRDAKCATIKEAPRKRGKPGGGRGLRRKNPKKAAKILRYTQRPHTPVAMKTGPRPLKISPSLLQQNGRRPQGAVASAEFRGVTERKDVKTSPHSTARPQTFEAKHGAPRALRSRFGRILHEHRISPPGAAAKRGGITAACVPLGTCQLELFQAPSVRMSWICARAPSRR